MIGSESPALLIFATGLKGLGKPVVPFLAGMVGVAGSGSAFAAAAAFALVVLGAGGELALAIACRSIDRQHK